MKNNSIITHAFIHLWSPKRTLERESLSGGSGAPDGERRMGREEVRAAGAEGLSRAAFRWTVFIIVTWPAAAKVAAELDTHRTLPINIETTSRELHKMEDQG